ncbi:hypothetical protein OAW26_04305 [Luminiphilus sp.]|nr:hypothetical protein [Luminiphilus sp.]
MAMVAFNLNQPTIDPRALGFVLGIPIILVLGIFIKNDLVRVLQVLFMLFVMQCYLVPLAAIVWMPDYLPNVIYYDGTLGADIRWMVMMLGDIGAIQLALLLANFYGKKNNFFIRMPEIFKTRSNIILIILFGITSFFRLVLGTGEYHEGEMAANPISNLLSPFYLMLIILFTSVYNFYRHAEPVSKATICLVLLYMIFESIFGSRASVLHVFYIALAAKLLASDKISFKEIRLVLVALILMILSFIFATLNRTGQGLESGLETAFFLSENYVDAIAIAIVQRVSLLDNLYQISNQYYNQAIYDFLSVGQFLGSTIDLMLPGTYFRGSYSLSALNMVWLYNYELYQLDTDWASINVPLYATNYLYFGLVGGWFVTVGIVFIYIRAIHFCFYRFKQGWMIFFGMYLMFNFSLLFLSSFGYEYLIRTFSFGFINIAIYGFLATQRFTVSGNANV